MEGVLPVWKPAGMTSHDVVAKARRMLRMKRIGHTGTLDPMVTGVLPLCLGRATRLVEYIQELPKEYEAELTFGLSTDTEDWTGEVLERSPSLRMDLHSIEQALRRFEGDIEQVPPMYSAVKVQGKKLYELARQGIEIERKARSVTIHRIDLLRFDDNGEYPTLAFRVACSKGTYIRTLCVDIGRILGVPAMMSGLTRTGTGSFSQSSCIPLEDIPGELEANGLQRWLVPSDQALPHLRAVELDRDSALRSAMGQAVPTPTHLEPLQPEQIIRLYSDGGTFLGIYRIDDTGRWVKPAKVFVTPDEL